MRARVVGQQRLRHRQPRRAERGGALQELAAVDVAVAILVVKVVHALVDLILRDRHRVS